MQLTIDGKQYRFVFGVGFVRNLDRKYGYKLKGGIDFGMGLTRALPGLQNYDTAILSEVLQAASEPELTLADTDAFLDNPKTDIEQVFKDVVKEITTANAVKLAVKKLQG